MNLQNEASETNRLLVWFYMISALLNACVLKSMSLSVPNGWLQKAVFISCIRARTLKLATTYLVLQTKTDNALILEGSLSGEMT